LLLGRQRLLLRQLLQALRVQHLLLLLLLLGLLGLSQLSQLPGMTGCCDWRRRLLLLPGGAPSCGS
jgi:hypothetical protein